MKKTIHIGQYGVARVSKNSPVDTLYTDSINNCLAITLVSEQSLQMIHIDTNVNAMQVAQTFKDFPTPYELFVTYRKDIHAIHYMLSDPSSPYSKESFIALLKKAVTQLNLPLWKSATFLSSITPNFGISFDKGHFYDVRKSEHNDQSQLRFAINLLHYLTSVSDDPNQFYSELNLDMQYTDTGWTDIPEVSYLSQKTCLLYTKADGNLKNFKALVCQDKQVAKCEGSIFNGQPTTLLTESLKKINDFSKMQIKKLHSLNAALLTQDKNGAEAKAKSLMKEIISCLRYIVDFSILVDTYENLGSIALKHQDLTTAELYLKRAQKYSQGMADDIRTRAIITKLLEIHALKQPAPAANLAPLWAAQTQTLVNKPPQLFLHTIQAKAIRWDEQLSSTHLKGMVTSDISSCNVIIIIGGKPGSFRVTMIHADRRVFATDINAEISWVGAAPKLYIFRKSLPMSELWTQRNRHALSLRPIITCVDDDANAVSLEFSRLVSGISPQTLVTIHLKNDDIPFVFLRHPDELKTRTTGQINWLFEQNFLNTPLDFILFDGVNWSELKPVELQLTKASLKSVNQIGKKGHNESYKKLYEILPCGSSDFNEIFAHASMVVAAIPYIQQYLFEYQLFEIIKFNIKQLNVELAHLVKTAQDEKIKTLLDTAGNHCNAFGDFLTKTVLPLCSAGASDYQDLVISSIEIFSRFIEHIDEYTHSDRHKKEISDQIQSLMSPAVNHFKQANYKAALPLFCDVLQVAQLVYTKAHKEMGTAHHNVGAAYHEVYLADPAEKSFLEKARVHLTQAYDIRRNDKDNDLAEKSLKRLTAVNAILEAESNINSSVYRSMKK